MNYVFLATGFEEIEALAPVDIMRRAGIEVQTVSIYDEPVVAGAHGVKVTADCVLKDAEFSSADFLVLPGGLPGATNLQDCAPLCEALKAHFAKGGNVAAICAAPMVLGGLGILQGKEAICYPSFEKYMTGATVSSKPVVQDGNVVTGKGPGFALDFGLQLVSAIKGQAAADEVAAGMLLK